MVKNIQPTFEPEGDTGLPASDSGGLDYPIATPRSIGRGNSFYIRTQTSADDTRNVQVDSGSYLESQAANYARLVRSKVDSRTVRCLDPM